MWGKQPQGLVSQNRSSGTSHPRPREGLQSQGDGAGMAGCAQPPSPLEALLLQQALEGGQVPHVGRVVQPGVLAVLDGVVAKLLPQPLLQVTTCAGERGGSRAEPWTETARPVPGRGCPGPSPPGTRRARKEPPGRRRACCGPRRSRRAALASRYLPARRRRRPGPRRRGGRPPPSAPRTAGRLGLPHRRQRPPAAAAALPPRAGLIGACRVGGFLPPR